MSGILNKLRESNRLKQKAEEERIAAQKEEERLSKLLEFQKDLDNALRKAKPDTETLVKYNEDGKTNYSLLGYTKVSQTEGIRDKKNVNKLILFDTEYPCNFWEEFDPGYEIHSTNIADVNLNDFKFSVALPPWNKYKTHYSESGHYVSAENGVVSYESLFYRLQWDEIDGDKPTTGEFTSLEQIDLEFNWS